MKNTSAEIKVGGKAYRIEATSQTASTFLANQLAKSQPATTLRNAQKRAAKTGDIVIRVIG